ncbi:MAG: TraR/DksA family transcriptional regulator [Microgenomates group bacterium Gr01-1014_7]|nr:MAG: TraR/DksA family transcriptional regulator [Microgenomates group bacterium Gr01-1014_7]
MLGFPGKKVDSIKRVLLRQQAQVEKNLKEVEEDDPVNDGSLAETSEPGTDSYIADTHTKTVILEKQLKDTKTSIIVALSKIKSGSYGKCEKCGKQIELGRLLAMPTASLCLSCSKKVSK